MRPETLRPLVVAVGLFSALVAGCSGALRAKPVADVQAVAGTWEGKATSRGAEIAFTLVVRQDGAWTATAGSRQFVGRLRVVDGRLRSESLTTGRRNRWTLLEGEGQRVLRGETEDGSLRWEVQPAKPAGS